MTNAWTRVRRHFSLRQRFIWRIRRRWKKHDLVTEEMWFVIDSVLSRRTPRSRTTSDGWMQQSLSICTARSLPFLVLLVNHMSSVLLAFNLRRIDEHQDWISEKQLASFVFAFQCRGWRVLCLVSNQHVHYGLGQLSPLPTSGGWRMSSS